MLGTHEFTYLLRCDGRIILPLTALKVTARTPCLMCEVVGLLGLLQHLTISTPEELWRVHHNTGGLAVVQNTTLEGFGRERVGLVFRGFGEVALVFLQHRVEIHGDTIDMLLGKEHTGKTQEGFTQRLREGTLLHVFLLGIDLLIIAHHELHGQRTDHRYLIARGGRQLIRTDSVEVGHDIRDIAGCLILHNVLTAKTMAKASHADTAHGRVVEVMQRIVRRDHMPRAFAQWNGDPVLIHITHAEITGGQVVELTEVERGIHILPMHHAVLMVLVLGEVGRKLLIRNQVASVDVQDMGRTTGKDTHEGTLS